jgi:hypothetical protein
MPHALTSFVMRAPDTRSIVTGMPLAVKFLVRQKVLEYRLCAYDCR